MIESPDTYFGNMPERCILIAVALPSFSKWQIEDHLDELQDLALTSGAEVIAHFIQERSRPDAANFIGKGKIEEVSEFITDNDISLIIFDDELTPAQTRNLEKAFEKKVIDRAALILDIFAKHAQSREAKVQVELAQLNYLLPRLTRQWQHLSRQVGGIGTKGPGETQLETDRRLVRTRISKLQQSLTKIANQKETQRQQRKGLFRAALIGYTNAGKSTMLKALTEANVLIQDQLFATLDTTVKRLELNSSSPVLLSDTVGFIRKLPHHLVASFRTTLAETLEADLLLHVVDVSHPHYEDHIRVVNQLLLELDISDKLKLLLFNKVDRIEQKDTLQHLQAEYPDALFVSASRHIGLAALTERLTEIVEQQYDSRDLVLDLNSGASEHLFYPFATIMNKKYDDHFLYLTVKFDKEYAHQINAIQKKYG